MGETLEELKRIIVTKGELRETARSLQGELGAFKAEIYNHFHALENRLDSLAGKQEETVRGVEEVRGELRTLREEVEGLRRKIEHLEVKTKHLDSSVLFLIVLGVITVILLATLLFRAFTMP